LQVINPAGLVARHNLDRISELDEVDARYLGSLGSDAAPLLIARIDELADDEQCWLANRLLRQWGPERPGDWRTFNWSESRARDAVESDLGTLRALAGPAESNCTGRR
jgi:two-component system sensor histidine kinase BaeS